MISEAPLIKTTVGDSFISQQSALVEVKTKNMRISQVSSEPLSTSLNRQSSAKISKSYHNETNVLRMLQRDQPDDPD